MYNAKVVLVFVLMIGIYWKVNRNRRKKCKDLVETVLEGFSELWLSLQLYLASIALLANQTYQAMYMTVEKFSDELC